jgi:hypothetical protein
MEESVKYQENIRHIAHRGTKTEIIVNCPLGVRQQHGIFKVLEKKQTSIQYFLTQQNFLSK